MRSLRQVRARISDPLEHLWQSFRQRYDRMWEPSDDPLMTPGVVMPPAAEASTRTTLIHEPRTFAQRLSDVITGYVGSWPFVGLHAAWFLSWLVVRAEPFPFGLLTLLVSLESIFLSTFVMMSQNRAAQRDRVRDDREAAEVEEILTTNRQQLDILRAQDAQLVRARETIELLHQVIAEQHRGKGHSAA